MAFLIVHSLGELAGRLQTVSARSTRTKSNFNQVLQWVIVGFTAISLGTYTLIVSSLPLEWALLAVLAVLCFFAAMVVGNVQRLLLAIIILDIPLQIDINLGYHVEAEKFGALGGWNISLTTIALFILYTLWLVKSLVRLEPQPRPLLRTSFLPLLYLAITALSVVVARDVTYSLFEIFLLGQMFLLYVYVASSVRTRQELLFIVNMLLISLILEILLMIGLGFIVDGGRGSAEQVYRLAGTLRSPNNAASYLSLLLAPTISLLLTYLGQWHKWLATVAFGLGGIALILTFSRGGWVAFAVSLALLCILAWHRGWLSPMIPFATAVFLVPLALLLHETVLMRLAVGQNGRIPLMKLAFNIIRDNPILGIGANNFALMIKEYATPELGNAWLYVVHNKYLLIWAETGIGGLMAFIWFLSVVVRQGWQCWQHKDRLLSPLALGFTAAIVGHIVHMQVDVFNGRMPGQLVWLIAALIMVMHDITKKEDILQSTSSILCATTQPDERGQR